MKNFALPSINWEKVNGLVPAIIQDSQSGQVLMLGYMNLEALALTCETGYVTFYSRTKKRLWQKGETSGYVLQALQIIPDCDQDTLLIFVKIEGPCCHLNQPSCFGLQSPCFSVLTQLEKRILSRYHERPSNHYTTQLFEQGIKRIAQKVGEEGIEVALAASAGDREEVISEAADLVYHLLVLLIAKHISWADILFFLQKEHVTCDSVVSAP